MNKREFLAVSARLAALGSATTVGLSGMTSTFAQSAQGYALVEPPQPTRDADKVEVLEFFWFGCPHCYAFEPTINKWAEGKPDHATFIREAPPLNPSWEGHSRAFYAAEAMGVTEQMFEPMFDAIHKERRALRDPKKIAKFAGEIGIDEDKFYKTMSSFTVNSAIKRALNLARSSGVTGVPSMLINGRYRTGSSLAGGNNAVIRVIDELVEEEHKRMMG